MRFVACGGGASIGAVAWFVRIDGKTVLVDAGLDPARWKRRVDFHAQARLAGLRDAGDIDAAIITHAHLDHAGGILDLLVANPSLPVYFHPITGHYAQLLLGRLPGVNDNFTRGKALAVFRRRRDACAHIRYEVPIPLGANADLPRATLLDAGHMPGSSCVLLEGREGRILITGDFNDRPSMFLPGTDRIAAFERARPDVLIMEGTYAGRLHDDARGVKPSHLSALATRVVEEGGTVLIPAFAQSRAQEVLAHLLERRDHPPYAGPIWFDDAVARYNLALARIFPHLSPPGAARDIPRWLRQADRPPRHPGRPPLDRPGVVIIGNGVIWPKGLLGRSLPHFLAKAGNALVLTGHQSFGSTGAHLDAIARRASPPSSIILGGAPIPLRAEIHRCPLSSHADHRGLLSMVRRTGPSIVGLVHRHGDPVNTQRFVEEVEPIQVHLPNDYEALEWVRDHGPGKPSRSSTDTG